MERSWPVRSPKLPIMQGKCQHGQFVADAQALATEALKKATKKRSRAADGILYALVALLLLAGLTHCTSPRKAAAKRHRHEHAAPLHAWQMGWADRHD